MTGVIQRISYLFGDHPDLLAGFINFLPSESSTSGTATAAACSYEEGNNDNDSDSSGTASPGNSQWQTIFIEVLPSIQYSTSNTLTFQDHGLQLRRQKTFKKKSNRKVYQGSRPSLISNELSNNVTLRLGNNSCVFCRGKLTIRILLMK
jgi:histone deacetylase complex regulatory component SIN3